MNINSISQALESISKKGFVPALRKGPTGVGYTLEELTGIRENNIIIPDFGAIELKSMREDSNTLITLLTFNRGVWQLPQEEIILKYGYWDTKKERQALYNSVVNKPNTQNLFCELDDDNLYLKHIDGNILGIWKIEHIRNRLIDKIQTLLLIKAKSKFIEKKEYFWYFEGSLLTGCNNRKFFELIKAGKIILDLRMHIKDTGKARNHGTGFRIFEKYLEELYLIRDKIL